MMIKKIFFGLFLMVSNASFSQEKPFSTISFDKVVLYDFSGGKGEGIISIIDNKGNLAKTVKKKILLDQETVKVLNKKLESRESYGSATASCFDPHLGIVYYFKNKPIAHLSICMDCNRLRSSRNIPAQNQGKTGKGEDAYYLLDGMSKPFRRYINELLKKYNFSHQIKK
ncbi:hypothetical protein AR438_08195 [Chryseobacterium aquaticum]|uniref:Uncharacterized protein n=1 Tax=Chryseobacterium aquaticum TaxID=452084 RepID=A0A0Q3LQZ3_9FLAO|nr:hypothetical protein [Chryseobacterium aquaticum]KQK25577.1 hypothetical protein AR438_08195 [Chryseobacterium aquaticum]